MIPRLLKCLTRSLRTSPCSPRRPPSAGSPSGCAACRVQVQPCRIAGREGAGEMSAQTVSRHAARGDIALWRRVLVSDTAPLVGLALVKLAAHLLVAGNYGYFRDELYYIDAGRHL